VVFKVEAADMDAASQPSSDPGAAIVKLQRRYQHLLDKSTPHVAHRWAAWGTFVLLYTLRVWMLRGFYIVTYGLGIFNLNLVLGPL
jgi:hypothetical protein